MSIARAWYVQCDGCGDPTPISTDSAKHARQLAKTYEGFVRRKDPVDGRLRDLCPRCAKEGER